MSNIHPIFDTILSREDKEKFLNQKAMAIWMVGLSGSGKSTLARALETSLHDAGFFTKLLDGDNLRTGINKNLGFSDEDRVENIRRAAEVCKLFVEGGVIPICSLISPTHEIRSMARDIIGADKFYEVFVDCPLEICEQRDVKGLYAKARRGEIKDFTGIDSVFEEPQNPSLVVKTGENSLEDSHHLLLKSIQEKITLN